MQYKTLEAAACWEINLQSYENMSGVSKLENYLVVQYQSKPFLSHTTHGKNVMENFTRDNCTKDSPAGVSVLESQTARRTSLVATRRIVLSLNSKRKFPWKNWREASLKLTRIDLYQPSLIEVGLEASQVFKIKSPGKLCPIVRRKSIKSKRRTPVTESVRLHLQKRQYSIRKFLLTMFWYLSRNNCLSFSSTLQSDA